MRGDRRAITRLVGGLAAGLALAAGAALGAPAPAGAADCETLYQAYYYHAALGRRADGAENYAYSKVLSRLIADTEGC